MGKVHGIGLAAGALRVHPTTSGSGDAPPGRTRNGEQLHLEPGQTVIAHYSCAMTIERIML
jgi:hypothetical protein